ncbi:UNVERIFIED_CONTAM: hypothetical protein HDU68_002119 [Siphonaria sp. JEL0065]|nr:hypothetical protein HDU68_002119 [Siphonaria sp. JEL0065]
MPARDLSQFQGKFHNPDYGTITIYEAGNTLLFDLASTCEHPDLEGVLGPYSDVAVTSSGSSLASDTLFAVFEIPLLEYKDYENPILKFDFVVDSDRNGVVGFQANLDDETKKKAYFERIL